jgi:hypothetical protein
MDRIILLRGKQGSGKTTLSWELERQLTLGLYQSQIKQAIFAGSIYKIHDFALKLMQDLGIYSQDVKKDGKLLQLLGTEWGRNTIHTNVWCKACRAEVDDFMQWKPGDTGSRITIISDARMENEFHTFPDALRISLDAPEDVRRARTTSWRENTNHISETGLDAYAEAGHFDMYFDTSKEDVVHQATLIVAQLQKNSWREKRSFELNTADAQFELEQILDGAKI